MTSAITINTSVESILFFCIEEKNTERTRYRRMKLYSLSRKDICYREDNNKEGEWIHSRKWKLLRRNNSIRLFCDCWLWSWSCSWRNSWHWCSWSCLHKDGIGIGRCAHFCLRCLEWDRCDEVFECQGTILDHWSIFSYGRYCGECVGTPLLKIGSENNINDMIICLRSWKTHDLESTIISLLRYLEFQSVDLNWWRKWYIHMKCINYIDSPEIQCRRKVEWSSSRNSSCRTNVESKSCSRKYDKKWENRCSEKNVFHIGK